LRSAVQPAGALGHDLTTHDGDGRAISTAAMLVSPALKTVKLNTVPVVSFRYWTRGVIAAVARKLGAAEAVAATDATRASPITAARWIGRRPADDAARK
jgi:hypothetical protein